MLRYNYTSLVTKGIGGAWDMCPEVEPPEHLLNHFSSLVNDWERTVKKQDEYILTVLFISIFCLFEQLGVIQGEDR